MLMKEVFSSDLRKNLGEALDKIYETKVPLAVKKKIAGGTKNFIFVSKDMYDQILMELKFTVSVTKEENEGITLDLKDLGLLSYGDTMEDAINSLVDDIIVYAEEYKKNIQLYLNAPNRKHHITYLMKVWSLEKEDLLKSFNFVYEN